MGALKRLLRALLFVILIISSPLGGFIWILFGSTMYLKAMNWCVIGEYYY